jgi:hypothetical protein
MPSLTFPDTAPDPSRCPLCGTPNQCAMETERVTGEPQPPCWCTQVQFPSAVLARVPASARAQACICRACARAQATNVTTLLL